MNAPNDRSTEPKSPVAMMPKQRRKFERRAWKFVVLTVVCLLISLAAPNAIFAYRIQRIVDNGGYVQSRGEYFGRAQSLYFGRRLRSFYREHYIIREDYEVFFGNTERADETAGPGLTLSTGQTDAARQDPGDEGPKMAQALGRVSRLSFAETSVTDQGLAPLVGMTSLFELNLSRTQVKGSGLAYLKGLNLLDLSLHGNSIDDTAFAFLPDFPNLERLDVGGTQIGNASLARVLSFSKLQTLDLEGLPVTDEFVQKLSKLPLWKLNLSNTPITDASIPHLEKMTSLADVNLCGTKISLAKAQASEHSAIKVWLFRRDNKRLPTKCEMQ